jgi:galactokinase
MTGGGFGGCTINLVESDRVAPFTEAMSRGYAEATGREPEIFVCSAAAGAERME